MARRWKHPRRASDALIALLDLAEPFCTTLSKAVRSAWHGVWRHQAIAIPVACALSLALVGTAYAWLTSAGSLHNVFGVGEAKASVDETLDGLVKKDVTVRNEGSSPVYVRAQVNIYWRDEEGNQLWDVPVEGTNYSITWSGGTGWSKAEADGLYYFTNKVGANEATGNLIDSVSQTEAQRSADKAAGRHLVVDIASQVVQANPADAVQDAWGATVGKDGALVPPPASSATSSTGEASS